MQTAGIVTHRQRPETASGIVFISLEDETGISNVIVHQDIQQRQRHPVFGARMIVVEGTLQNELSVIHVVADHVRDFSHWLAHMPTLSRNFH